ncbi:cytochrome P450 2F3-like [Dendropsophus ebraccatus]|uniref:cytochrome P450 2F3-like n=1 Tax=Dendropsophus ebraccatus TaxID=150705 RepID=UPI0038315596
MFSNMVTGWERIDFCSMTIALLFLCFSFLILLKRKKGNLPPGPRALPFVGNLHQLDTKDLLKSLKELSNKYGPVFTIYLGPQPNVVLYGYKAVKEVLVEQADNFSGRGPFPVISTFSQGNGISFSNGEKWKVLRRFALVTLRNFGTGKRSVEERIQEEAQIMLEEFSYTKPKCQKILESCMFYLHLLMRLKAPLRQPGPSWDRILFENVHQEINKVIGRNRCPTVEDRSKMAYTDAVVHEIQRFTTIIPLSLPHCVTRDTEFRGYHLPEGTNVTPVLISVHNDPEKFKEPEAFNPENFLDENSQFKNNEAFMPFSTGKRICPGEGLARMELFIFFTTFLQNFDIKPTVHPDEIDLTPSVSGLGNIPSAYQLIAVPS